MLRNSKNTTKQSIKLSTKDREKEKNQVFTKNIFDILKIRLALENIKFSDSEVLHEINQKLINVNKRTIDLKFVNETIEKLFQALKANPNKNDKKHLQKEINNINVNVDRSRAMSHDISKIKWLDSYLERPKVRGLRPLKFNEFEKDTTRKLSFFEENELCYSINKKNSMGDYDLDKIQLKMINDVCEKRKKD